MVAQTPDVTALKAVYKEMEFFSLLRELGPSEDTRRKDYQRLETADEIRAWVGGMPDGALIAVAFSPATLLDGVQFDLCAADGVARSMHLDGEENCNNDRRVDIEVLLLTTVSLGTNVII